MVRWYNMPMMGHKSAVFLIRLCKTP